MLSIVADTTFSTAPPLALAAGVLIGKFTPLADWFAAVERRISATMQQQQVSAAPPPPSPATANNYGIQIIAGAIIVTAYLTMLIVYVVQILRGEAPAATVVGIVYGGVVAALSVYGVHLGGSIAGQSASLTTGIVTQVAAQAAQLALTPPPVVTVAQTPAPTPVNATTTTTTTTTAAPPTPGGVSGVSGGTAI